MSHTIKLDLELTPRQVRAYHRFLVAQYEHSMQLQWFDDRYRYVPAPLRTRRILDDHPALLALFRTLQAARHAVRELELH
ncbi:hypothetical protein [Metapseudomonas furukawaii]|uniref:Uncharacterized protein n=1 Tax=Metapseudomonas furukawaii TaxID=1149133 RepID=A0AAD1BZW9_METFU|nr:MULTISPECIES: hypothetical protein [Pseudomonas]ELS26678.1 hypothetical protein ppKF707_3096 [Pseudomonas furukawaii]OWJ92708.1 hypothetical protein B6S59_19270 [Pseudomonas sp. A46]BAU74363.1 hypothetical protein KF707C_26750 [Pseudomonas furukawaii]